jgi:hypothetical protein
MALACLRFAPYACRMRARTAQGCATAALGLVLTTSVATAQQQPPPGQYQQQPPPGQYQQQPPPGQYQQQPPPGQYQQQPGYGQPPPPRRSGGGGWTRPDISIRLDPFNWLLEGRLGLELEVEVWEFLSVEVVPVFVANTQPPSFNLRGRDDVLSQHSNGLGPLAGASIGAGFWLMGTPFEGYFLRAIFTNYGYTYESSDDAGRIDQVSHTERHLVFMFGSQSNFGPFSISFGLGLGYELNQQERCFPEGVSTVDDALTSDCDDELDIALERPENLSPGERLPVGHLNGPLHPIYLGGRISLGFTF